MTGHELLPLSHCADPAGTHPFSGRVGHAELISRFREADEPVLRGQRVGDGPLVPGVGTAAELCGDAPLPATGHAAELSDRVGHRAAAVEAARRSGAAVPVGARATPGGETVAGVRDPEDTVLRVVPSGAGPDGPSS
ncbi:bleomycin resistance protein [Kocuria kalidii]|uniref:bleomycin resistance protein n=1 Tax=Kocuria kalidii TaxID=3376283 RepID=UPI0037917994